MIRRVVSVQICLLLLLSAPGFLMISETSASIVDGWETVAHGTRSPHYNYSIEQYSVDITLSPDAHSMAASTRIFFRAVGDVDSFELSLMPAIQVTNVSLEPVSNITWARDGWKLSITPQDTVEEGSVGNITVWHEGEFGPDNPNSWSHYIGQDITYLHGYQTTSWFPRINVAPLNIRATVPTGYTVVCQGALVSVDSLALNTTYTWDIASPGDPTVVLFAGRYASFTTHLGGTNVTLYLLEDEAALGSVLLEETRAIMEYFSSVFSNQSRQNVAVVEADFMAHRGAAFDGLVTIHRSVFTEGFHGIQSVLSHELSHLWWGYLVYPTGSAWRWLEEGFAQYSSILYQVHRNQSDELLRIAYGNYVGVAQGQFGPYTEQPLSATQLDSMQAQFVIYGKGSAVVHMLRYEMGEEDFFALLSTICAEYANSSFTVGDLKNMVEDKTNRDMDWFFQQWIYTTKHLDYSIASISQKRVRGGYETTLAIERLGDAKMPVDVLLYFVDGTTQMFEKAWNGTEETKELTFTTEKQVDFVSIDPNMWLLDIDTTNNHKEANLTETGTQLPVVSGKLVATLTIAGAAAIAMAIILIRRKRSRKEPDSLPIQEEEGVNNVRLSAEAEEEKQAGK